MIVVQHEKVSSLLAKYIGKPKSQIDLLTSDTGSSQEELPTFVQNQRMVNPGIDWGRNPGSDISHFAYRLEGIPDMENALMAETAAGAMDELIKLLRVNEPFWIKSPSNGRLILDRLSYERIYPRAAHFISCNARVESSKDSATVTMPGMDLVDMFLDPVSAQYWLLVSIL
jgi:homeobox-leucine zipper protein